MEGITNKRGYVYILVNPAFPGFLKVGKTAKEPSAEEYRALYKAFNENAVAVREQSGFAP